MSATGDRPARETPEGFTLIEALVVVAIMALISGLAFPRIERMIDNARLASARSALAGAVMAARARAIRTDAETPLTVSGDGLALLVEGLAATRMPPGIHAISRDSLIFYSDGSASGGRVTITSPTSQAVLAIRPETGTARWTQ